MKNRPLVSIIIINWNGKPHLLNCLSSLSKIVYPSTEIIVMDNNSMDGSVEMVKNNFPKIKVVTNKENLGFCRANNAGAKIAKGKYVLLLNNDTIVTPAFLGPLVEKLEKKPENGMAQPKIIFWGNKKLQTGCALFTSTGFLYHFGYGKNPDDHKYNISRQTYSGNGSCLLVKKEVVDKVGLFDESFFSYFEETDFCQRALMAGYKIWYEPKATIYHIGSVDNSRHKSSAIVFNSFRNRITCYLKNLEAGTLIKILPVHLLFTILTSLAYIIMMRFDDSLAVLKAIGYNIVNLKSILLKRKDIQSRIRKIKDNDYLNQVSKDPRPDYYFKLFTGLEKYND